MVLYMNSFAQSVYALLLLSQWNIYMYKMSKFIFLVFFLKTAESVGVSNNVIDCSQCFAQRWEWTAWKCSTQCQHNDGPVDPYGRLKIFLKRTSIILGLKMTVDVSSILKYSGVYFQVVKLFQCFGILICLS